MSRLRPLSVIVLVLMTGGPASAYLKFGTTVAGRPVDNRWFASRLPIRYFVNNRAVPQVSREELQGALDRSFRAWDAVESASFPAAQFVGFTDARPFTLFDGMTVIGFEDMPELERVLAQANFLFDMSTGEIVEGAIRFNTTFPWSTSAAGTAGRIDVESVATHEIGHMIGLQHSAIGETEMVPGGRRVIAAETVMFPIAFSAGNIDDRRLKADDIAGVSDIYPEPNFRGRSGSISGRVTKNGTAVIGAHIVAFNLETKELIGGFSLGDAGEFSIAGLRPGVHVVRVEPLDDADLDSFFGPTTVSRADINLQAKIHDELAAVRGGGNRGNLEIKVVPK